MPKILPDDQILEIIYFLNSKKMEFLNMFHTCAKDCVKYNWYNVQPIHIFLSGSRDTGKSHLVKATYHAISKTLLHHCKDPKNLKFFYLGQQEYQQ